MNLSRETQPVRNPFLIAALGNSRDVIVLLDCDWRVVEISPAAGRLFDLDPRASAGLSGIDLIGFGPIDPAQIVGGDAPGRVEPGTALHEAALGRTEALENLPFTIAPIKDGAGELHGYLLRVPDVEASGHLAQAFAAEQRYRTLVDALDAVVWEADPGTLRYITVSDNAEALLGFPLEQWIANPLFFSEVIHPAERTKVIAGRRAALRNPGQHEIEYRAVTADGRTIWLKDIGYVSRNPLTGIISLSGLLIDVTDRRRTEDALLTSERRLRLINEHTSDVVFAFDLNRNLTYVNSAVEELTGYGAEEIQTKELIELIHSDDQTKMTELWDRLYTENQPFESEFRIVTREGQVKWCLSSWGALYDERGERIGVQGRERDITERKLAEERFSIAFNANPDPMTIHNHPDGRYVDVNESFLRITGYSREDVIGKRVAQLGIVVDRSELVAISDLIDRKGSVRDFEYRFRTKTGEIRIGLLSAEIMTIGDKQFILAVTVDTTDRTRLVRQLKEEKDKATALLSSLGEGVYGVDRDGRVTFVNPRAQLLLGWTEEELLEKNMHESIHYQYPDGSPRVGHECPLAEVVTRGSPYQEMGDFFTRKDGSTLPVDYVGAPILSQGEIVGAVVAFQDATERLQMDDRIRRALEEAERANKLKDEFLATLSHELRTPLSPIVGWARIIELNAEDPGVVRQGLPVIVRNAQAQIRIVDDLLDMSRIITGKMRLDVMDTDLAAIISSAVETVRLSAEARGVELMTDMDSSLPFVSGDPNRLQQVFWNLLSNAIKFTPGGGRVTIQLTCENSSAAISVIDTGIGIEPEFLPHVFDRFRQADASWTRQHGGLGLGLAIARSLVEMHGGRIEAHSEGPNLGSRFTVKLPFRAALGIDEPRRVESETAVSDNQTATSPIDELALGADTPRLDGIRVLVVDDEPDARRLVERLLSDYGARVESVASANEAFNVLRVDNNFDLLISDIGMPEVDGYEFMRRVRAEPDGRRIAAIALSAYVRNEDRARTLKAGYDVHIPKPVEPLELLLTVHRIVDRTRQWGKVPFR